MKRVVVTLWVPDDTETHELATELELHRPDSDPTVWTMPDFFQDVADGLVSPEHDGTVRPLSDSTGKPLCGGSNTTPAEVRWYDGMNGRQRLAKCATCGRIGKPNRFGEMRQHSPVGKNTASHDRTMGHLWASAEPGPSAAIAR